MFRSNRVDRATLAALHEIANCIDDICLNDPRLEALRHAPVTRILDVCENAATYAAGLVSAPRGADPRGYARARVLTARGNTIATLADSDWPLVLAVVVLLLEHPEDWCSPELPIAMA